MQIKAYQILNIIGLVLVLIINFLANALPIGGRTTGELSALYPSLFTPAGYVFSIWGVIYFLLIIFAGFQARGLFSDPKKFNNRFLYRIDIWFFVSCIGNASWIFAWHYQLVWLSMVLMLVILCSLIIIYLRLGIGHRIVGKNERNMVHHPFSVYLGWITVATIANAATVFIRYQWNGAGISEEVWTSVMITIASAISVIMLFVRKDLLFSLVIIWAFSGIIFRQMNSETTFYPSILFTAFAGIFFITTTIIFQMVRRFIKKDLTTPG
jgi:hypothetical protein